MRISGDGIAKRCLEQVEYYKLVSMLWCCESIESDLLYQLANLICWDEWNFDLANQARV